MKKTIAIMQKIQLGVGGAFLLIFLLTVSYQIIARYLGIQAMWTQDVAMYSFIWAVFMGSAAMVYEKRHFAFTSLGDSLKNQKAKAALSILISIIMLVFAVLLCYYGNTITQKFWNYRWVQIPEFKRGWTWLCLPVCGATSSIYLIAHIVEDVQKLVRGGKE